MRAVLHIVTNASDTTTQSLVDSPQPAADTNVTIIDVREGNPDYNHLLDAIFAADSVQVW